MPNIFDEEIQDEYVGAVVIRLSGAGRDLPDWGRVMALSYTGIPSPTLLKAFSVIT